MKLVEYNVVDFINKVDEKSATPGGGSVSALASSLGAALLRMVGHLTVSKKKFKSVPEDIQQQFVKEQEELLTLKEALTECIDKDTEAYNQVMLAFKLPKATEEEKVIRSNAIEQANMQAIEVPLIVAKLSFESMKYVQFIIEHGNKFTVSDMGVACLMLHTGMEGALLNVKINLPGLSNKEAVAIYQEKIKVLQQRANELKETIMKQVEEKL